MCATVHKILSHFIIFSFVVSCASKQPRPEPPPTPEPAPGGAPTVSTVPPPQPAPPGMDLPKVTLVFGGAGVASFAAVGLLKRFHEEGIKINAIISTGWPTLFAIGYSFLKSVHDLEWFAMRLDQKDFYKAGIFSATSGYASHEKLSSFIETAFTQRELGDGKVPIIVSATNTELGNAEVFDSGNWRAPLLKTMSVPGIYRPYPSGTDREYITSLSGIDVEEAKRRSNEKIVVVLMYDDYFKSLRSGKKDSSDALFRKLYLAQLQKSIAHELKDQELVARIFIDAPPTDFTAKRRAIFAGYKEGARIARILRN